MAADELSETLEPGDPNKIQEGPFKSYEAILDAHLSGESPVRILSIFPIETTRAAHQAQKEIICPARKGDYRWLYITQVHRHGSAMSDGRSALEGRHHPKPSV